MVLGTPIYMAPEVWMGAPASYRSDVYSLGALIYEIVSGLPPHGGVSLKEIRQRAVYTDARPLSEVAGSVPEALSEVVARCLSRTPDARYATANEVLYALEELATEAPTERPPEGNPYRGLRTFEAEHAELFFGREVEIRQVLERLRGEPFVLVVGDSGVGKSSLCRAGVMTRLQAVSARRWRAATLIPGAHPVLSFASSLAPFLDLDEAGAAKMIAEDPGGVRRRLAASPEPDTGVVVFIDQLEEMVTLASEEEAAATAELLQWLAVPTPGIRLLATVRGDFLSRLATLPHVADELSRALYFLRPIDRDRVRDVIVGPARATGVSFESEVLVEELVASTERAGGGLPLLQFALAELWEARDAETSRITHTSLTAIGGVAGALTRHADQVLAETLPEVREVARRVLLDLVSSDGTRARRRAEELDADAPPVRAALDALIRGRLVVARDTTEGAQYEIAHEALLTGWSTLARWLASNAEARRARVRLRQAVSDWERLSRARDVLWSRLQLDELSIEAGNELSERERAFVDASRRSVRRGRVLRAGLLAGLPLMLLMAWLVVTAWSYRARQARIDDGLGVARGMLVKTREIARERAALRDEALALFGRPALDEAERAWARMLRHERRVLPAYARASRQVETTLLIDHRRRDTRALLADLLLERALLAEERGGAELDELRQRLALYDEDGSRRARLNAPARVRLHLPGDEALASLMRYELDDERRYKARMESTHRGRQAERELAPGSYLLVVTSPGAVPIRYPFMVRRGEDRELSLDRPPPPRQPGVIYIPAGRFLFGSAAPDDQRRDFFHTAPLHARETGAFWIARRETTFGDYIRFLEALPPAERDAHRPRIDKGGFQGALSLERLDDGAWQLTLKPSKQAYVARAGEAIVYPGRDRRARQRWLEMPVVGVTVADAEAYAAWLARTGELPGARLCTELEWERAARGADGREYPHGERLGKDDANFDDTYDKDPLGMGPDEVGSHPGSRSPFGVDDMAGNVWEWTRSALEVDGYVARGGSYYYGRNTARCTERAVTEPSFRDASVGLRVCAD